LNDQSSGVIEEGRSKQPPDVVGDGLQRFFGRTLVDAESPLQREPLIAELRLSASVEFFSDAKGNTIGTIGKVKR